MKSTILGVAMLATCLLPVAADAQQGAAGAAGPAATVRWEDALARTKARGEAIPAFEASPMLYQDPALIAQKKAAWKAAEENALQAIARGLLPESLFPNDNTDPDLGAVFGDRAATTYESFDGPNQVSSRPSDTHLAVGCTHVGVVTNKQVAFYFKNGSIASGPVQFADFWPGNPAADDLFDPKIIYDPHENRWLVMALNGRRLAQVYWAISISKTSDPLGEWWTYFLRSDIDGATDTALWCDFPGFAYDSGDATNSLTTGGGIYIGGNMYTSGDSYQYAKIRVLRKYQLYNGDGVNWWDFWGFDNADGSNSFTVKPMCMYTATASPTMYVMNTVSGGATWVTKRTITHPLASGPTLTGPTQINVNTYDVPPSAKQSGGGDLIDTGDCRTQDPWYSSGSMYLAHGNISDWGTPASLEASVRFYRINASTNAVTWQSTFGADALYYFFPSIAANDSSEAYMVMAVSGADRFAEIRHTGRQPADLAVQGSSILKSGESYYNPSASAVERWGDYSGVGIDPAGDAQGAWTFLQFADSTTTWDTWIGGVSYGLPSVTHLLSGLQQAFTSERYFTWELMGDQWATIAVGKNSGAAADDVALSASNSCGYNPYQTATLGATVVDFIASNGNLFGAGVHQARVYLQGGAFPPYEIETRWLSTSLASTNTSATSGSFGATDLVDNFQASVTSGKTYAVTLDITTPAANYDLFRFAANRIHGRRFVNDGESESAVAGADESIVYTAAATGKDGFVVVNNNDTAGNYSIRLWLKPLVTAVGTVDPCTAAPLSYPMTLVEGTSPFWSITAGAPAGMIINSSTGVISWATPHTGTYNITVRATNAAGFDEEALTFRFNCSADFNCDGVVDDEDFVIFLPSYNALTIPPASPKCDLNYDGIVEDADFSLFVVQYDALLCP